MLTDPELSTYLIIIFNHQNWNIKSIHLRRTKKCLYINIHFKLQILCQLGEKLEDSEVNEVVKDCMDAEDDDGMIPYARKYHIRS